MISAPLTLRALITDWKAAGEPRQAAMLWPRRRWEAALPTRDWLSRLPDALDREAVRRVAIAATDGAEAAEAAFVATMIWGYGWVGYGPYRVGKMLETPGMPALMHAVATTVRDEGAVPSYIRLATDCRIRFLGPAFGTKFLAFCQLSDARPAALIHDALVGSWLARHGRRDLSTVAWAPPTYLAYLNQMHAWADELVVTPETIEYVIFQSQADARGNQWAARDNRVKPTKGLHRPVPGARSMI